MTFTCPGRTRNIMLRLLWAALYTTLCLFSLLPDVHECSRTLRSPIVETYANCPCKNGLVTDGPWTFRCLYHNIKIENVEQVRFVRLKAGCSDFDDDNWDDMYVWKPRTSEARSPNLKYRSIKVQETNNSLKLAFDNLVEADKTGWECRLLPINSTEEAHSYKNISILCTDVVDTDNRGNHQNVDPTSSPSSSAGGSALIWIFIVIILIVLICCAIAACVYVKIRRKGTPVNSSSKELDRREIQSKRRMSDSLDETLFDGEESEETMLLSNGSRGFGENTELRRRRNSSSASTHTNASTTSITSVGSRKASVYLLVKNSASLDQIYRRVSSYPEEADAGWGWDNGTPIMEAARMGSINILRALLQLGADVNKRDNSGYSALMWAAVGNQPEAAQLLLSYHADPTVININKASCVHYAASAQDPCVLALFIENISSANRQYLFLQPDLVCNTPLHWAAYRGRTAQCLMLCAAGAEECLSRQGYDNLTPEACAKNKYSEHHETAEELTNLRNNIEAGRSNARMYLKIAVCFGLENFVRRWKPLVPDLDISELEGQIGAWNSFCYPKTRDKIKKLLKTKLKPKNPFPQQTVSLQDLNSGVDERTSLHHVTTE